MVDDKLSDGAFFVCLYYVQAERMKIGSSIVAITCVLISWVGFI